MISPDLKETLDLLSKCKNFIYVFGAGITYQLFLSNVFEIHSNINDSWSKKFGLCNVCKLSIYVSTNTTSSNFTGGQNNKKLDDNIIYDNHLHECILQFIKESK